MSDREKTYKMNRATLESLKSSLRAKGINPPPGDSGEIRGKGVVILAEFNESAGTLKLTVKDKPFIISYDYIWKLIDDELKKSP